MPRNYPVVQEASSILRHIILNGNSLSSEGLPFFSPSLWPVPLLGRGQDCLELRASSYHCFIVGALRACETVLPLHPLRSFYLFPIWHVVTRRVARTWAPVPLSFHLLLKGGPIGLQLRVSNEALQRARVARAKETNGLPFPSYTGRGARTDGLAGSRQDPSFPHLPVAGCNTSWRWDAPSCARRTSTALPCAFREHRGTHPRRAFYTGHFSSFHAISQNIHSYRELITNASSIRRFSSLPAVLAHWSTFFLIQRCTPANSGEA